MVKLSVFVIFGDSSEATLRSQLSPFATFFTQPSEEVEITPQREFSLFSYFFRLVGDPSK